MDKFDIFLKDPKDLLSLLHELAARFDPDSQEYAALEIAAKAIIFAFHESVFQKFRQFLSECGLPGPRVTGEE